jgi:hypothetical protein
LERVPLTGVSAPFEGAIANARMLAPDEPNVVTYNCFPDGVIAMLVGCCSLRVSEVFVLTVSAPLFESMIKAETVVGLRANRNSRAYVVGAVTLNSGAGAPPGVLGSWEVSP